MLFGNEDTSIRVFIAFRSHLAFSFVLYGLSLQKFSFKFDFIFF